MTLPRPHHLPVLLALLLADATGVLALAETLPDPVAPAVLGRPLDRIRPARATHPAAAKPAARKLARTPTQAAGGRGLQKTIAPAQSPATQQGLVLQGAAPGGSFAHQPKQALDDRTDDRVRADDVGKGTHFARKPLPPGVYFDDKDRAAVRKYYEAHPASAAAPQWQIGAALPAGAPVAPVPKAVLASLPKLPPGHRYLQVGTDVLLVAAGSGMVVDGIATRATR